MGLGLLGLTLVLPIIALVKARSASRLSKGNENSWQTLTQRIHALETQAQELKTRSTQQALALEAALQQLRKPSTTLEGMGAAAPPDTAKSPAGATGIDAPPIEPARTAAGITPSAPA